MQAVFAGALPAVFLVAVAATSMLHESVPSRREVVASVQASALPGVRLDLESAGAKAQTQSSRVRLVALRVARGNAPGALLAPGAFEAVFRGRITVPLRDRYTFAFEGFGKATLEIGGKKIFEVERAENGTTVAPKRTRLKKGANDFVLRYASAADGSAACRLLWKGFGFAQELVPPKVLSVSSEAALEAWLGDAGARHGLALRGRAVAARQQCVACHELETKLAMPELKRRGTKLDGIGARVQRAWLEAWLLNPRAIRPTARMPRLLHGDAAAGDARDLAAWLATLRDGAEDLPEADTLQGDAARGGALFARLGCVSCHSKPDAKADAVEVVKADDVQAASRPGARIPLRFVAAKWKRAGLVSFLENPAQWDRWIRMPDFDLSRREAADLATYLLDASEGRLAAATDAGDPARGAKLAARLGCASCHAIDGVEARAAQPWKQITAAAHPATCSHAQLDLAEADRMALRAFQVSDPAGMSFGNYSPGAYAARQLHELRCTACHAYDGRSDDWSAREAEVAGLLGEVDPDEVDQIRPTLTWAGEKLRSEWFAGFLRGDIEKPRTWLHARMPRFRSRARYLADGFAAMHGLARTRKREIPVANAKIGKVGARIAGAKGHACTTCHSFGEHGATMVFESPGINLVHARARLRPEFYSRWMLDPQRFDVRTKMTKFADEKGRTQLEDFEGDARKQFEAIWQYLLAGDKMGAPSQR